MSTTYQGLQQSDISRKPSDLVWSGCDILEIITGQRSGIWLYDDFTALPNSGANGQNAVYKVLGTNGTAALLATDDGGVVELATSTTQNNEAYLAYGQTTGGFGQILNATPNEFWFEARVRIPTGSTLTSTAAYVGLAKTTDIASGFIANTTGIPSASVNHIGFSTQLTSAIQAVYGKGAAETVYNSACPIATSTTPVTAYVLNSWVKLGMHYWGNHRGGQRNNQISFYVNGVEVANTAGTSFGIGASATNVPSSVFLTPFFGVKNPADTTNAKLDIDWVRCAWLVEDTTYG